MFISDNDIITANIGVQTHEPVYLENQEALDQHKAQIHDYSPRQKLWDDQPDSFPCLMLVASITSNPDGADNVNNLFLYDVKLHGEQS